MRPQQCQLGFRGGTKHFRAYLVALLAAAAACLIFPAAGPLRILPAKDLQWPTSPKENRPPFSPFGPSLFPLEKNGRFERPLVEKYRARGSPAEELALVAQDSNNSFPVAGNLELLEAR